MKNFTINKNSGVDFLGTRFAHSGSFADGQKILKPRIVHGEFNARPLKVSKSVCRMVVIKFLDRGYSSHNLSNSVAWVILEYCKAKNIAYKIDGNIIRKL